MSLKVKLFTLIFYLVHLNLSAQHWHSVRFECLLNCIAVKCGVLYSREGWQWPASQHNTKQSRIIKMCCYIIQTTNLNDNQLMGMNGDVLLPETFPPKYLDAGGIQDSGSGSNHQHGQYQNITTLIRCRWRQVVPSMSTRHKGNHHH